MYLRSRPRVVRRVRGELSQGRKPTTVNDIISKALRPLLGLAVELGMLEKSPLDTIKALKGSAQSDSSQPGTRRNSSLMTSTNPRLLQFLSCGSCSISELARRRSEAFVASTLIWLKIVFTFSGAKPGKNSPSRYMHTHGNSLKLSTPKAGWPQELRFLRGKILVKPWKARARNSRGPRIHHGHFAGHSSFTAWKKGQTDESLRHGRDMRMLN